MHYRALPLLALLAGSRAAPTDSPYHVIHESRSLEGFPAMAWSKRAPVPVGRELPVRIGLTQNDIDRGHDLLMEVSEHDSPLYGKHYTQDEIIDIFAPVQETYDAVLNWLESAGIQNISQSVNKQWLQFDAAVEDLEALLKTEYHEYVHEETGSVHVACEEYYIPAHIQKHVDYVNPGIRLSAPSIRRRDPVEKRSYKLPPIVVDRPPINLKTVNSSATPLDECGMNITPACVRALYKVPKPPKTAVSGNELGIFEDLGDYYSQQDLNIFFQTFPPKIPKGTHPILRAIDGAKAPTTQANSGQESMLDFSLAFPLLYPQGIVLFQTDDPPTSNNYIYDGFLNNFYDAIDGSYCTYSAFGETGNSILDPPYPNKVPGGYKGQLQCGKYSPTNVISISYGGPENYLPASYQRRQCNEVMKLGLQGVSVVVASGDSGVAYGPDDTYCLGPKNRIFSPGWPASCPYITTVGGTLFPAGANVKKGEEVAVTRFGSGGGFSNIFPRPKYQKKAVEAYFEKHEPIYKYYDTTPNGTYDDTNFGKNGGRYNRGGRGMPDFAAVGDNVIDIWRGHAQLVGGTSASAPVFASLLTRINEERLLANKSTLGFVNPVLYAHPHVLQDITVGSNPGCGTKGFSCEVGWDPVTGLGTPHYPKMLKLFMSLP